MPWDQPKAGYRAPVCGRCVGVGVSLPGYFEELPGYLYFRVPLGTTADLPKSPQPQPLFFLVMAQPIGHPLVCVRVPFGRRSPWWGAWERGERQSCNFPQFAVLHVCGPSGPLHVGAGGSEHSLGWCGSSATSLGG